MRCLVVNRSSASPGDADLTHTCGSDYRAIAIAALERAWSPRSSDLDHRLERPRSPRSLDLDRRGQRCLLIEQKELLAWASLQIA